MSAIEDWARNNLCVGRCTRGICKESLRSRLMLTMAYIETASTPTRALQKMVTEPNLEICRFLRAKAPSRLCNLTDSRGYDMVLEVAYHDKLN